MRQDSKLSRMLHVLLHMARHDGPFTSEQIAAMLGTNGAVVRRTLAGLRDAGLVRAEKGHHGGWTVGRDLSEITLLDIYRSLGTQRLFGIGSDNENPACAVEAVVNDAVADALAAAETQLMARFSQVTLAQLAAEFDAKCLAGGRDPDHQAH
ncbi:MAG: transcriptional regulator [Devosia sp.]|uniref:Rrf2 family transcriptional regulator n=1 Tax=Devosia sp. TaxID=1871048 RepID=UPI0026163218|nr:Rrf2 family transcriptional regulator [Devosia sp.]MDB5527066.1 transcriptional regulator [Devosia sp.]